MKIKRCPFCDSAAELCRHDMVQCTQCPEVKQWTVQTWNKRPEPGKPVSLEKCKQAVAALYTNWESYEKRVPNHDEIIKAVLDAAWPEGKYPYDK
jgi:NADPH-dependent glutamate synthase beta subunit-like oxidoreductase